MKINYIKTKGFRKFKDTFETPIYNTTLITGKNRSGKSNILYAVVNTLLGTNLSGDEKTSLVNKDCIASYAEMHFEDDNGIKHTLIRGKNKYASKGNILNLDGKNITQTELINFYRDKKLFLSIINPLFFLTKKPAEQKELVDKYLSIIKPKEIFDTLDSKQQKLLLNKYYKDETKTYEELSDAEKENFINCSMLNICMEIAFNKLSKKEQSLLETIPLDIPTYITELNDDIKRANAYISKIEGQIQYAENIASEKVPNTKTFDKDEELSFAIQELSMLNSNQKLIDKENQKKVVEKLETELLSLEDELQNYEKEKKLIKSNYNTIKNSEDAICPTCNQHMDANNKALALSKIKLEADKLFAKYNILTAKIGDVKLKKAQEICKFHSIDGDITVDKEKQIAELQSNINILNSEKNEINSFNAQIALKKTQIKNARADIDKFNIQKQEQLNSIDTLTDAKKVAQKLYISYIEEKMRLAKKYLKDVDIKFYSVLKTTGEIKEDFVITYKGNNLADLSRSETIAAALEIANMFNKISKAHFPIFIDDYESCADYDFIKTYSNDTQLIVAKVEKGNALKIADYNSKNATIIKPEIKGYRTLKLQKNVTNAVKKAA